MVIERGQIWWVDFGEPSGSRPGKRRPAVIVQDDRFNRSALATVLVAAITSNLRLAGMPGNVFVSAGADTVPRDSVINVTALQTVDKSDLVDYAGSLPPKSLEELDRGLRLVLGL